MDYTPTLAGFLAWVRSVMGVPAPALPDNSVYLTYAFNTSLEVVNQQILAVSPLRYQQAVYNLGGDNLVNWAQDIAPLTYWTDLRTTFKILSFVPGVVSSASDESSSTGIEVSESLKNLTLGQLQNLKTPWGRLYLSIAQEVGTGWGIS